MTAEDIKNIRSELGWTQVQMAAYLSVSDVVIWRWETGQSTPDPYRMAVLQQLRQRLDEAKAQKQKRDFVSGLKLAGAAGIVALLAYLFKEPSDNDD